MQKGIWDNNDELVVGVMMVVKSEVVEEGKEEDKWVSRREGAWRMG